MEHVRSWETCWQALETTPKNLKITQKPQELEKTGTLTVRQGKAQEMSQQEGHVAVTKVPTGLGLPSLWYSPCPKLRFNPCSAESQSLSLLLPTPQCDVCNRNERLLCVSTVSWKCSFLCDCTGTHS